MHSEYYVHRIGRTGRAHAIGDAISFITPEDQGPLRSLERFSGRGIVRKKAEGFDYNQAAPPRDERGRGPRASQRKIEPRLPGNSPRGSGDARHGQNGWSVRNASSNNRPRRRSYRRHRGLGRVETGVRSYRAAIPLDFALLLAWVYTWPTLLPNR